jgi:hypothetical protein
MVYKKFFAITKFELNYHKDNQILTNDTTILPPKKQGAECAAYFGECKKIEGCFTATFHSIQNRQ